MIASIGVKNGRSRYSCVHPAERENTCVIPQRRPATVEKCTPAACVTGKSPVAASGVVDPNGIASLAMKEALIVAARSRVRESCAEDSPYHPRSSTSGVGRASEFAERTSCMSYGTTLYPPSRETVRKSSGVPVIETKKGTGSARRCSRTTLPRPAG